MSDYLIWATDKYLETHPNMHWCDAANYISEHVTELGDEYSMETYVKETSK